MLYKLSNIILKTVFAIAAILLFMNIFGFKEADVKPPPLLQKVEIPIDHRTEMIEFIQKWEGGMSNDPRDPGGWTNKGITYSTFRLLSKQCNYKPTKQNFIEMPDDVWLQIFDLHWNKFRGVKDPRVRAYCTDYLWGSGTAALYSIQKVISIHNPLQKIDGRIGEETIQNINAIPPSLMVRSLHNYRVHYLKSLNRPIYIVGWMNRVNSLIDKFKAWENSEKIVHEPICTVRYASR